MSDKQLYEYTIAELQAGLHACDQITNSGKYYNSLWVQEQRDGYRRTLKELSKIVPLNGEELDAERELQNARVVQARTDISVNIDDALLRQRLCMAEQKRRRIGE